MNISRHRWRFSSLRPLSGARVLHAWTYTLHFNLQVTLIHQATVHAGPLVVRHVQYWWPRTNLPAIRLVRIFKMKLRPPVKSSNIIYLITCRRCGQQYVGETGQPLHCRVNSHRFNIAHRRTEESPEVEHFTGNGHSQAEIVVTVIDQLYSREPMPPQNTGKQVDQDSGDFASFRNEPQSRFTVKTCSITVCENTPWIFTDDPPTSKLRIGASREFI